jgi:hypothetical protein
MNLWHLYIRLVCFVYICVRVVLCIILNICGADAYMVRIYILTLFLCQMPTVEVNI